MTEAGKVVRIPAERAELEGQLFVPQGAPGMVVFAHGSGSSRHGPRSRFVAGELQERGLGTLLMDLLSAEEEREDTRTSEFRFDIGMLAHRLIAARHWLEERPESAELDLGYFGASTGGGAALVAAAGEPDGVGAVVSRGGRPDLAGPSLPEVRAPTLLIVGGLDEAVIEMNRSAMEQMEAEVELEIVPGATHLFEEPGKLEEVARLAGDWFARHLGT